MNSKIIQNWLCEYKVLTQAEVHSYSCNLRQNESCVRALYSLFEYRPTSDITLAYLESTLDPVCHQLYEYYRSKELELRRFTLEYIPSLIWLYLMSLSLNDKRSCGGVEALLIGIYNLDIVHTDGKPKVNTIRVPSITQPSVFHEPVKISSLAVAEVLSKYNKTDLDVLSSGQNHQYEAINSQNRQEVLTTLLQSYNADISSLSTESHKNLCKVTSRLVCSGFSNLGRFQDNDASDNYPSVEKHESENSPNPRLNLSPAVLIELLSGVYYIMFNGNSPDAIQAMNDIHNRACYELYADVLLVTRAIQNSLQYNPSGQPRDGPMGICVALSPAAVTTAVSKTAITNASFKTRKLPDDIPLRDEDTLSSKHSMPTIDEDGNEMPVTSKHSKTGVKMGMKIMKKMEKAISKEASPKTVANGDAIDGSVSVAVVKGHSKQTVDSVEMQGMPKKLLLPAYSSEEHDGSLDEDSTSVSSKDKKGMSHSRNSSVNSFSYSTDL